MSATGDRSIGGGHAPLVIVLLVILTGAAGGVYLWMRSSQGPRQAVDAPEERQSTAGRSEETIPITLFLPAGDGLNQVPAGIRKQPEAQLEAREALAALLGSGEEGRPAVLKDLVLRALYLDGGGTAYADLQPAGQKEVRASAGDELLALYAIVNTLTYNFSEVRSVRFLVNGREVPTLAGHIDITRSFMKRTDLVKP